MNSHKAGREAIENEADHAELQIRRPPHSVEAEQCVLGSLLQDNSAWDRTGPLLTDNDFYLHEHRLIYSAIGALIALGTQADVITVFEQLQGLGKAQAFGGLSYLNALAQSVAGAANIRSYAEIVRERSILRKLIAASNEIATNAFNPQGRQVSRLLEEAESKIFQIGEAISRLRDGAVRIDKLAIDLIDRVQEQHENGAEEVTGLRTGFYELDRMTSGLQKGDLIVLAARPSMGKTALALNIAEHVAVHEGLPVLVFSMEMNSASVTLRLASSLSRIEHQYLSSGRLADGDWGRLGDAVEKLTAAELWVDDASALKSAELRARARRVASRFGGKLGLIVIDYLQLMSSSGRETRANEVGEMSRSLKALAKELQCPVIALSQLNRSVESREDKRPMMSDLRESGAIEQDADTILFIYRDDYYNHASQEPGIAEIIVSKQRNGPVGTVKLAFAKHLVKFELAPT